MQSNRSILREEIVRWFDDPNQLRQALREGSPSRSFDALVTPSADYGQQVFQLIDRADKDGWLLELISRLLTVRSGNALFSAKLQPIADRLAAGHSLDDLPAPIVPESSLGVSVSAPTVAIVQITDMQRNKETPDNN
jgi:Effector-associated domain 1